MLPVLVASVAAAFAFNVSPPACDAGQANCEAASGTVIAVERVDPDGDGDAHFVIADPGGITVPGISVIDVAKDLRPHPLPGRGDLVAGAGPVLEGSFGQRQIEATEVRAAAR